MAGLVGLDDLEGGSRAGRGIRGHLVEPVQGPVEVCRPGRVVVGQRPGVVRPGRKQEVAGTTKLRVCIGHGMTLVTYLESCRSTSFGPEPSGSDILNP